MIKDLIDKDLKINELEQKIENAIEYIINIHHFDINTEVKEELLKILGGENE
jgi:hypothetical protein